MCTLIRASRLVTWTRAWQMQQRKGLKLCCSSWEAMLVSNEFVVVQRPKSACCYSVEAAQNRLSRHFLRFWKLLGSFNVFCEFSINMFFSLALAWTSAFWVHDGPFPGLLDTFQAILPFGDLLLGLFCSWAFVTFSFDPFEGPCGASTRTLQSNSEPLLDWTPQHLWCDKSKYIDDALHLFSQPVELHRIDISVFWFYTSYKNLWEVSCRSPRPAPLHVAHAQCHIDANASSVALLVWNIRSWRAELFLTSAGRLHQMDKRYSVRERNKWFFKLTLVWEKQASEIRTSQSGILFAMTVSYTYLFQALAEVQCSFIPFFWEAVSKGRCSQAERHEFFLVKYKSL